MSVQATPQPTPQYLPASNHPDRVWFNKDIRENVQIRLGQSDELVFDVDDVTYTATLVPGIYKTSYERFETNLTYMLNDTFIEQNIPVVAILGGIHDDNPRTVIVLEYNEMETGHRIENIRGSVVDVVFGSVFRREQGK